MSKAMLEYIEQLAHQLSPEEKLALVDHLTGSLEDSTQAKGPRDLYGIWRRYFRDDLDIDQALEETRNEWKGEQAFK